MIQVELWQVVLFVLAGVAMGAIVVMLYVARTKQKPGRDNPALATTVTSTTDTPPATPPSIVSADKVAAALSAAETRQAKIKKFLNTRIVNGRNISVDEASKCLSVSPRRIRKLLDTSILIPIPAADGTRRVSAVSVLDLVVRRESGTRLVRQPVVETREPTQEVQKERTEEEPEKVIREEPPPGGSVSTKLEPGPSQKYWYYVAGADAPVRTLREALQVIGLGFAYTEWRSVPANVRARIRREKVMRSEEKSED